MTTLASWLRKKRVWIPLAAYTVYALFGFLVLPGILRGQIVEGIRRDMKRESRLDRVYVNPILLSLALEGFELKDPDGTTFVAFDRLYLDYQLSSLVRWAITLRKFSLENPRIHLRLMPDGKLNFADIQMEEGKPPRLVMGIFEITDGSVRFTNLMSAEPEDATLTPVNLTLRDFTTIPRKEGQYHIAAIDPGSGSWEWNGDLTFEPLHSAGVFEIRDSRLMRLYQLAKRRVNFEVTDGRASCRLAYEVDVRGDSLVARIEDSSIGFFGFALREKEGGQEMLRLDSLTVTGIHLEYPEQRVTVDRVLLAGANVAARLNPDTTLNWQSVLVVPTPRPAPAAVAAADTARPAPPAPPARPWDASLRELAIRDLGVAFEDRTVSPAFATTVDPVNVTVRNIVSKPGAKLDLAADATVVEGGRLDLSGTVVAQPPAADLQVRLADLGLPVFQPYLSPHARLQLVSGTVGVEGATRIREERGQPVVSFKGRVESRGFQTRDLIRQERFIAWKAFQVEAIDYSPKRLAIGRVRVTEPYAKVLVHRDRTTNIQDILGIATVDTLATDPTKAKHQRPVKTSEALTAMQTQAAAAAPPFPVRVGTVEVVAGSADFADLSLILPFAARIERLAGTVKGLSSDSAARAAVVLDGELQPSGVAQVRGEANPLAKDVFLDLTVVFRGFSMPVLTPYAGQFLGREIDKGQMSLDLGYRLQGRHLVGENKIVLDQLELGEKVESPEATRLPVGLALAILKDSEGKIDLDVPVEGDLDDPKFRIGKIIWDFIMSLLTKVATAPFALLGGLFGGGGEEMSRVDFEAGASTIPEDQMGSLDKLAEALGKRPELDLEVRGRADSTLDADALRKIKFAALAGERMASNPRRYGTGIGYPLPLLEDLYTERLGKEALAAIRERHSVPAGTLDPGHPKYKSGSKKVVLDESALSAALQDELTALQSAGEEELLNLANARADAIRLRLVGKGLDGARVFVLDPAPGKVENGRIRLDLTLRE